jgi:uncharacterized protein (TIGR00375 family)
MRFIADLHVHSPYSRATSKTSTVFGLAAWAAVKGIKVVGSGDFTHPAWFAHLHQWLQPAEPGLFRLKPDSGGNWHALLPPGLEPAIDPSTVRFMLSAEISSIYKRGGKVRKVHNLLYAPDFEAVRRINSTLATLGNISSDGRPILGLDSRDLLEILLEKAPEGFLVPAHIWTPWFSIFGSKSGFDRIEDCFGDLSHHIFALETGLSSDPEMNRRISALDRYALISNSDCHSPGKLGREANIFVTEMSFHGIREALRHPCSNQGQQRFAATIEFYPEEGKYHCDGHRKCNVCLEPPETRKLGGLCPSCGRPLTIGVLHRVMELADRDEPVYPPGSPIVHSLIPLQEIVAELCACGPATKKALAGYTRLITLFGSEFSLLLDAPLEEIQARAGNLLAEAVDRVRSNRVIRKAGFDGEFGVIRVFDEGEQATLSGQTTLFGGGGSRPRHKKRQGAPQRLTPKASDTNSVPAQTLNSEQQRVVASEARLIVVQAGPGTGKTHTLVKRVQRVARGSACPCTVITFTNKAAEEIRQRLQPVITDGHVVTVATFHGYCLRHLRQLQPGLRVIGPEERHLLLDEYFPEWGRPQCDTLTDALTNCSRSGTLLLSPLLNQYRQALADQGLIDLDTVVPELLYLLREHRQRAEEIRTVTGHLFVDEFQDVNQGQYQLVALLAEHNTVFAIGDPDQAIYGFRGSDPQWFDRFLVDFRPEYHQLTRNYRSGEVIVRAAEALIGHNPHLRPLAPMQAMAGEDGCVHQLPCTDPKQEAATIADQIEVVLGGTSHRFLERFDASGVAPASLRDIGILYRTSRQAGEISRVLNQRGIPFQLVDLEAYYSKGSCRLLYAWILVLAGMAEPVHLLWLLAGEEQLGRPIPPAVTATLLPIFRAHDPATALSLVFEGLAQTAAAPLVAFYHHLLALTDHQSMLELVQAVITYYQLEPQEDDLRRFGELALGFEQSLPAFAGYLLRFSDSVLYDNHAEAVTLSTLHAAKGLEFPIVFIAGVEDGLLPLAPRQSLPQESVQAHLEEERRLLFVGITRAVRTLYLSWCRSRSLYGSPPQPRQRSLFFEELPAALCTPPPIVRTMPSRRSAFRQLSLFS